MKNRLLLILLVMMATVKAGQPLLAQNVPDYRPVYHFTPPKNWINDPNGLVYHDGEYHLFYQHNPFGNKWGHMSWGHAVSRDLLRWQHLPVAIPEFTQLDKKSGRDAQTAIFSGSSVIDKGNKSRLCPPGTKDCMIAVYTGNITQGDTQLAQYQNLAYSSDRGRTWTQYANNPILDIGSKEFRDPNMFWYAPGNKWVMATVKATEHKAAFYESTDLKNWRFLSDFGGVGDTTKVWECPALIPVPIGSGAGPRGRDSRWVLFISTGHPQGGAYVGMQYFVGTFDGKRFVLDKANPKPVTPAVTNVVDWGKDYYAAIQYNNVPAGRPAPIMIGWLNNWAYAGDLPTTPFKGAMSLPREVMLKQTPAGFVLVQQPIADVARLRGSQTTRRNLRLASQRVPFLPTTDNAYELELTLAPGTSGRAGVALVKGKDEETLIYYADGKLHFDRRKSGNVRFNKAFPGVDEAPLTPQNGLITLRIFVDKSVVEVFANGGERVITNQIFPTQTTGSIEFFAEGGTAEVKSVKYWPMTAVVK